MTIILGIGFLVVTFLAYAHELLLWYELVPLFFLLLPPYLYCRNKKIVNVYLLIGTLYSGIRFYSNYLLASTHADLVMTPITMAQPIVKQFTGMVVILVLYVWYCYMFYTCYATVKGIIKDSETYEMLANNKITRYINMFTVTSVIMFGCIVSTIWTYNLVNYAKYLLVFICTSVLISVCFYALVTDALRVKKEEFVLAMKKEHPTIFETEKKEHSVEIVDLDEEDDSSEEVGETDEIIKGE